MFLLTLEPTHLAWQPAPALPTHAPADAHVPVLHFFPASAHQFFVAPEDFADRDESRPGLIRFSACKHPGAAELSVEVNLADDGQQTLGSICVRTPSSLLLTRVQFPMIVCPDVQPVDHLLSAYSWGDDILDPIYQIPRFCTRTRSRTPLTFIDHGENELIYVYPAAMAMQFMTLYNANRSTYLACYSEGDETLSLNARIGAENTLRLSVNHYPFVSGREWHSPECATAHLAGGWLPAADLYASRMRACMPQADNSPWLRSFDGWVEVAMHFECKSPECRYSDLPDIFKRIQAAGLHTMHIFGWSGNGHDTLYPDYDINPALGTAADLRRAMDQIKQMGGRAMLYTNSRLVDLSSPFYKNGGSAFVCRQRDGNPYLEKYGTSAIFAVACPACAGFRDHYVKQVARMVGEFGAHAIQMDQINSTIGFLCFDPAHEHPTPSTNFLPGWSALARQVEAVGRAIEPDFFMWGEGCQERFGRHIAVHQGHGEARTVTVGAMQPALYKYIYPQAIVTGIGNSFDQIAHVAAQGKPVDIWNESKLGEESRRLLKEVIALRHDYPEYYYRGSFTAGADLETAGPVEAFGIQGAGGQLLVSLWAPGAGHDQAVTAWLRHPRQAALPHPLYPSGLQITGGEWLHLSWQGPLAVIKF